MNTTTTLRVGSPASLSFHVLQGDAANPGSTASISFTLVRRP